METKYKHRRITRVTTGNEINGCLTLKMSRPLYVVSCEQSTIMIYILGLIILVDCLNVCFTLNLIFIVEDRV